MKSDFNSNLKILLLAVLVGIIVAKRESIFPSAQKGTPPIASPASSRSQQRFEIQAAQDQSRRDPIDGHTLPIPDLPSSKQVHTSLVARELRIVRPDSTAAIQVALSAEDAPGLWLNPSGGGGTIQTGVHGNGFPFVIASDGAIRNFGLGRVDGKNASPILVYRSNDEVKIVFGLSMTDAGQPPFLVHYSADGKKHDFLGSYCENPSRVCTQ